MKQKICTGVHLIFLPINKVCGNINFASLWRLVLLLLASLNLWQCHFTQSRFSNPIWVHCQLLLLDMIVCAGKVKPISLVIMICCGNLMPTWVCWSSVLFGTLTVGLDKLPSTFPRVTIGADPYNNSPFPFLSHLHSGMKKTTTTETTCR